MMCKKLFLKTKKIATQKECILIKFLQLNLASKRETKVLHRSRHQQGINRCLQYLQEKINKNKNLINFLVKTSSIQQIQHSHSGPRIKAKVIIKTMLELHRLQKIKMRAVSSKSRIIMNLKNSWTKTSFSISVKVVKAWQHKKFKILKR